MSKIICIGLNRTGTTTLECCLRKLGYSHIKIRRDLLRSYRNSANPSSCIETLKQYDSCSDWPWFLIYKDLDRKFPGSKFILTLRKDEKSWLKSISRHSLFTPLRHCRKLGFGYNYPFWHKKYYVDFYKKHVEDVREYFKNRPNDLLMLDFESGDNIEKLCEFLKLPATNIKTPDLNKAIEIGFNKRVFSLRFIINCFLALLGLFERKDYKARF